MATAGTQGRKRILREEDMTKVEFETSEEVDVTPTFDTMGLREDLLRGIYAYGRTRISVAFKAALAHKLQFAALLRCVVNVGKVKDNSFMQIVA